jgi:hypothetical protein
MIEIMAVYILMAIAISTLAIYEDKISKGYKPNARDGDKDGFIQDGTRWQRKA